MIIDAELEDVTDMVLTAADAKSAQDVWKEFDATARREALRYEAAAMIQFNRERDQVAKVIKDAVPIGSKAIDPDPSVADPYIEAALVKIAADYAPNGRYHKVWLDRYRALVSATFMLGGRNQSNRAGVSFSLRNPRAMDAVRRRVTRLTGNVTETTVQRIRDVIVKGREEGIGVSEVARRIKTDAFNGDVTRSRAVTIARTETVGALNEGQFLAATDGGVMQSKRWLSQGDARVRESHAGAEGDGWLGLDDTFSNGLRYPHEPGAPAEETINCRCTLLYDDRPPSEANRGSP